MRKDWPVRPLSRPNVLRRGQGEPPQTYITAERRVCHRESCQYAIMAISDMKCHAYFITVPQLVSADALTAHHTRVGPFR